METSPSVTPTEELEVPGEPGVYWCGKHRKVKTRLRCGRCERPICVKCTIMGPIGARCPECSSNRSSHIYQVTPLQFVATFVAMVVLNVLGAALVSSGLGFFVLFYAPLAGTLLGKVVNIVTRGKRGTPLAVVASLGAVVGALSPAVFRTLIAMMGLAYTPAAGTPTLGVPGAVVIPALVAFAPLMNPWLWLYLLLVIPSLWYWIK